jgi:hypothetical protein
MVGLAIFCCFLVSISCWLLFLSIFSFGFYLQSFCELTYFWLMNSVFIYILDADGHFNISHFHANALFFICTLLSF